MSELFHFISDLSQLTPDLPEESILSRNVFGNEQIKVTFFAFATGQELTEHTAARPAILHFLEGEADLMLGTEARQARPGTWVHMAAHLPHSIVARTAVTMLLILLPGGD